MSVPTVQRRGSLRAISSLPAAPTGTKVIEVDVAGVAYQSPMPGGASYFNQTVIQLPMATAGFPDDKGHTVTANGGVAIDNTTVPVSAKFIAGASIGQGIHIAAPTTGDDFNVGASPMWTMEGWFKSTQTLNFATLCGRDSGAGGSGTWALLINNATGDGKIAMYTGWGSGAPAVVSRNNYCDGVRHHVAIVHTGTWTGVYVDGVLDNASITSPLALASVLAQEILLGGSGYASRQFIGNMDNWRIVNGVALYTGHTYTVPTPPFPTS